MSDHAMPHNPDAPTPIARRRFADRLDDLDDRFTTAALTIVEEMPALTRAFLTADLASIAVGRDLSLAVAASMREVEDDGFVLLAREAPVSGDLRRLVAVLRLTADVTRSASLLAHVPETLEWFDPRELPAPVRAHLGEMGDRAAGVFHAGIDAWRARDPLAAVEVEQLDEGVDALQRGLLELGAREELGEATLLLGLIARYFERIADHGVALARDVAFVVTGERIASPA